MMKNFIRKNWKFFSKVKVVLCKIPFVSRVFDARDSRREKHRMLAAQLTNMGRADKFLRNLAAENLSQIDQQVKLVPLSIPNFSDNSLRMYVYSDESLDMYISACIRKYGVWEPVETQVILNRLQAGDVFIDIGANIGYYSVLASIVVGDGGRVVAFEPEPSNYALLAANCKINALTNIQLVNAAVSDSPGAQDLFVSSFNRGDNRLCFGDGTGASVQVATVVLDETFLPKDPNQRLIVKIDTQGWEAAIILGNFDTLASATMILFEWSPAWITRNGHDPLGLIEEIERRGFSVQRIGEDNTRLIPFGSAEARAALPRLLRASGAADDPSFYDLIAERPVLTINGQTTIHTNSGKE
jgi:FkbM family methyltransferase